MEVVNASLLLVLVLLATASAGAVSDPKEDAASGRFPLSDRTAQAPAPAPAPKNSVVSGIGAVPSAPAPTPPVWPPILKEESPYIALIVLTYAADALRRGENPAFAIVLAVIGCAVFILGDYPGLGGGAGGGPA